MRACRRPPLVVVVVEVDFVVVVGGGNIVVGVPKIEQLQFVVKAAGLHNLVGSKLYDFCKRKKQVNNKNGLQID
jgi:hypothetical protein